MERLNEIMLKQRRQQLLQQRARQTGALPRERGEHTTRLPLPEQTAALNRALSRPGRSSRGHVEVTEVPGTEALADVLTDTLTLESGESLSRPSRLAGRQSERLYGARRDLPASSLPRRARDYYYRADDYLPALRGDALSDEEEWEDEEDDDEGGMRYGDWEDAQELLEATARPARSRSAATGALPAPTRSPAHREGAALHRQTEASSPLLPHDRLALSAAGAPAVARQQRVTQPLRPNALADPALAQLQETLRLRQARQTPGRERQTNGSLETASSSGSTLPAPFGSQRPVCPKCKGAGYLRLDVPFGHPHFGKPIPCECKEADLKERRRQQLRSMSNLEAFRDKSFKNFNYTVPGVRQAYQAALEYAREPDGWLLLVGPNGCGKTHLAAAIANLCLENGSLVLFATVPDLLDHLRAAFAPEAPEVYDQLFARMREAELLVLDDLGAQQSSPWANEKLFQLLNYRYNLRYPTVITANPRGLQAIDERIRSRLSDASLVTMVTFEGALDYRPRNPRRH